MCQNGYYIYNHSIHERIAKLTRQLLAYTNEAQLCFNPKLPSRLAYAPALTYIEAKQHQAQTRSFLVQLAAHARLTATLHDHSLQLCSPNSEDANHHASLLLSVASMSGPTKLFRPSTNHQKHEKASTPPISTMVQFMDDASGCAVAGHSRKNVVNRVYTMATPLTTLRYRPSWKGPYGMCSPRIRLKTPRMTGVI